jgi:peptidyl-prolyl cis-trans isomerase C
MRSVRACALGAGLLASGLAALATSCKHTPKSEPSALPSASAAPLGLTPELARTVLAKVGEREITLGEYAVTLERMDPLERLRYQSADRRKQLLNEMIQVELLAQEAQRRGLDKQPETQEAVRQILRDELLRRLRQSAPNPADIPEAEVRAYYDAHHADFNEPERRRVAHIVVASEARAQALLTKAKQASPSEWGKLVQEASLDKPSKPGAPQPDELAGDLGIVGPVGHPRGDNPRVPEPLRAAVFQIDKVGDVLDHVVPEGGQFHIVRMTGRTEARDRSFQDAERTIRVAIVQQRIRQRENELESELRQRYPVSVDDAALAGVKTPSPSAAATPAASVQP